MAGLDVIFAREPAELPEGVRLLLVPYADLQAATWSRLKTWVEAGGVLWTGAAAAVTELAPLFGLRLSRRGGMGPPVAGSELTLRFVASWDDLDIGETLTVPLGESPHLPISPMRQPQAQVLAVDEADRPLLTGHAIGRGRAFFCAYPLEHLLTYGHEPNAWSHAHRLYRALRAEAGIRPTFSASDPALSLSTLNAQNTEGPARLLIAINHSLSPVTAQVFGREPLARVVDVESQTEIAVQDGAFTLTVDPWEVRVLAV
jgi:hypothetical protein